MEVFNNLLTDVEQTYMTLIHEHRYCNVLVSLVFSGLSLVLNKEGL